MKEMETDSTIREFKLWLLKKGVKYNHHPLFEAMIIESVETYISEYPIQEDFFVRNQLLYDIWKEGLLLLLNNTYTHAVFRGIKLSDYQYIASQLIFKIELDEI